MLYGEKPVRERPDSFAGRSALVLTPRHIYILCLGHARAASKYSFGTHSDDSSEDTTWFQAFFTYRVNVDDVI